MSHNLNCEEDPYLFRQTPTSITDECMGLYEREGWRAAIDRYIEWLKDEHEQADYASGQDEQDYRDLMDEHIAHVLDTASSCEGLTLYSS